MTATLVPVTRDVRVIALIGAAHGVSHYYQLAFTTMLLIVRQEAGLGFEDVGLLAGIFYGSRDLPRPLPGLPSIASAHGRSLRRAGTVGSALALISVAHSFLGFASSR